MSLLCCHAAIKNFVRIVEKVGLWLLSELTEPGQHVHIVVKPWFKRASTGTCLQLAQVLV